MANQQSAELSKLGIDSYDDPTASVAAQFPTILVSPLLVVLPVRRNQFDAVLFHRSRRGSES